MDEPIEEPKEEPIAEEPVEPPKPVKEIKVEAKDDFDTVEVIENGELIEKYNEYFRIFTDKESFRIKRSQLDEIAPKLETDRFVQLPDGTILAVGRIEKIIMFKDEDENAIQK